MKNLFHNQMKGIYQAEPFGEHQVVQPGIAPNLEGKTRVAESNEIRKGSRIYVPENTAAVVFGQDAIELVITDPGNYEYTGGTESLWSPEAEEDTILKQIREKFQFNGHAPERKRIVFVNLREIKDLKFGTKGATPYTDVFFGKELEVFAYGSFSVQITNPVLFLQNFVPPNVSNYHLSDAIPRSFLLAELRQSFAAGLSELSARYRIAQIPLQGDALRNAMMLDEAHVGSWEERYGFRLVQVLPENLEYSEDSKKMADKLIRRKNRRLFRKHN